MTVCIVTLLAIFSRRLKTGKMNYNCSYAVDGFYRYYDFVCYWRSSTVYHTRDSRVCERLEGEQMKQTLAL